MMSAASQASRQVAALHRQLMISRLTQDISDSEHPDDAEGQLTEFSLQALLAAAADSEAKSTQQLQQQVSQPLPRRCQRLRYYRTAEDGTQQPVVLRFSLPRPDASQEHIAMKKETKRLLSFKSILTASGTAHTMKKLCVQLVQEGFFYAPDAGSGSGALSVRCAFCGGCVSDWQSAESPDRVHRQLFSTCPFVLGMDVANVPMLDPRQQQAKQPVQCSESSSDYTWTVERTAASADQEVIERHILRSGLSHRFSKSLWMGSYRAVTYRMDSRHFEQRCDLPEVQAVTRLMGLPAKDVQAAVHERLLTTGDDFEFTEDLAKAAWGLAAERLSRGPVDEAGGAEAAEEPAAEELAAEETASDAAASPTTKVPSARKGEEDEDDDALAEASPWNQCRVCMVNKIDVVLLKCGHHCCCSGCVKSFETCPICRAEIVATVTINSK